MIKTRMCVRQTWPRLWTPKSLHTPPALYFRANPVPRLRISFSSFALVSLGPTAARSRKQKPKCFVNPASKPSCLWMKKKHFAYDSQLTMFLILFEQCVANVDPLFELRRSRCIVAHLLQVETIAERTYPISPTWPSLYLYTKDSYNVNLYLRIAWGQVALYFGSYLHIIYTDSNEYI